MTPRSRVLTACAIVAAAFLVLYRNVIPPLVTHWSNDENYSHAFLIVPLAGFFVWKRREQLASLERRPAWSGGLLLLAGVSMLVAGTLGAELFLTRVSMLFVIAGAVVVLAGWGFLQRVAFPIAFLLLMIPIPAIIFNQIAFPLQLLASKFGEGVLQTVGVPVVREGNVMILASTELQVAEACSGIRSLTSLLTLGIVYGYFMDPRLPIRVLFALSTIPIAIFSNALRVAGTGIAAHFVGPEAAEGFFHTFSGWLVFAVAFALLFVVHRVLVWAVSLIRRPAALSPVTPS